VQWRVLVEVRKLCGIVGRSVLGDLELADRETVVLKYVSHGDVADDRVEEIGLLYYFGGGE